MLRCLQTMADENPSPPAAVSAESSMNLSHPLNIKIQESGKCEGSDAECMCNHLLDSCSWKVASEKMRDCMADDGNCRRACVVKHLGSLDEGKRRLVLSGASWSLDRGTRRLGDVFEACEQTCRDSRRACDNATFSTKLAGGGSWAPEGCLDAARELSDPMKNGGSEGRRFACPERLAGKRGVQKS